MENLHLLVRALENRDASTLGLDQSIGLVHARVMALAAAVDDEARASSAVSAGVRDKLLVASSAFDVASVLLAAQEKTTALKLKDCQRLVEEGRRSLHVSLRVAEFADALAGCGAIAENALHVAVVTRSDLLNADKARQDPAHLAVMALGVLNAICAGSGTAAARRAAERITLPATTLRACLGLSLALGGSATGKDGEDVTEGVALLASLDLKAAMPAAARVFADPFHVLNALLSRGQPAACAKLARSLQPATQEQALAVVRAWLESGGVRGAAAAMRGMDAQWTPALVAAITDFSLARGAAPPWLTQREAALMEERLLEVGGEPGRLHVAAQRLASARFASARPLNRPSQQVYDAANPAVLRDDGAVAVLVSEWWAGDAPAAALAARKLEVLERTVKRKQALPSLPDPLATLPLLKEAANAPPPEQPRVDVPPTSALKKLTIHKTETERLKERLSKRLHKDNKPSAT